MGKKKLEILKNKIDQSINLAIGWLLHSGIQNLNKNKRSYGSFNAWYDPSKKKFSYNYSEISGYLVTFMCFMFKLTKKRDFLERAKLAANWLIKNAQKKDGGFQCLFLVDNKLKHLKKKELRTYTFDNGVIINGLVNLYKITKNNKYLKSSIKCANLIEKKFTKSNYELMPIYDYKKKIFYENKKNWSEKSGPYHVKVSIGLTNLYKVTKIKKYFDLATNINYAYLKHRNNFGDFKSTEKTTNFHPFLYALEGYWSTSKYIKLKNLNKLLKKSILWFISKSYKNQLPRLKVNSKFFFSERIDIYSQTLRMIVLLDINKKKVTKEISKKMIDYQFTSKDKIDNGSFSWGKFSNGKKSNHPNCWVTAFSVQSFLIFSNIKAKSLLKKNPFLIV